MSATNRSDVRRADDFYETPAWCVARLLETGMFVNHGHWLEPSAGHGAIIRAVKQRMPCIKFTAVDAREEAYWHLYEATNGRGEIIIKDFLLTAFDSRFDVVAGNPPYSLAMEFIKASLPLAPIVAMLLRLNFLGSAKRSALFRANMPDVYVLPNRPSFTGGGTDATEYCWAVWTPERNRRTGSVAVLDETPASERK